MLKKRHFDLLEAPPRSRASAWEDILCETQFAVGFQPGQSESYWGDLSLYTSQDRQLTTWRAAPALVSRTHEQIKSDAKGGYAFAAILEGEIAFRQGGEETVFGPNEIVLADATEAFELQHTGSVNAMTFAIGHSELERLSPKLDGNRVIKFDCRSGLAKAALGYLKSIALEADNLSQEEFDLCTRHFVELSAILLDDGRDMNINRSSTRAVTRNRVMRHVRRRMMDSEFGPSVLASEIGLSPRYLQTVFQEVGTTVQKYIRDQRLGRARDMLQSPAYKMLSVTEIAFQCGFSSLPYFSTAYRQMFNQSPRGERDDVARN